MTKKLIPSELNRLRIYIESVEWRFAKTMPQWPHFYTIRDWNPDKEAEFTFFAEVIQKDGVPDRWGKNNWYYLKVDQYKYWVIDNVLNRAAPILNSAVIKAGKKIKQDKG